MTKEKKLKIIPLGGLSAIGKNMALFEYGNEIIIVDCGIQFPSEDMPGVDLLIPDFAYVKKNRARVKGIIITHGHEDHIGAIPYLLKEVDAPIYATRITIGLIQSRLEEKRPGGDVSFVEVSPRDVVHIGAFMVEFIRVNHSIIDGVGLAVTTPAGVVIHTGDYKIDFSPVDREVTDLYRFADYGEKGVLLLMSDSTNAERRGYTRSESVLGPKLIDIFSSSKGRIFVATFASNINRIQQVLDTAQKYNRRVVVSGATMQKNIEIARTLGCLKYRDDLVTEAKESDKLTDKRIVVLCTGTQGEPMSALTRMAAGAHRNFVIGEGDTVVITASIIPGNDRMVNNVINSLLRLGAEVYYEEDEDIHVSGHGSQEELKLMIALTRPRFFMPIHGEYRHLKAHAGLAESLGIKRTGIILAQNGDIIALSEKSWSREGKLELKEMFVDGGMVYDMESGVIRERHTLSTDGILIATLVISKNRVIAGPDIVTRGFVAPRDGKFQETIAAFIEEHADKMLYDGSRARDIGQFLRKNLRNQVYRLSKMNPIIELQVIEV